MKKLISLILILCMACMLIPAMADEDMTGEWYGNMYGNGIILTLNADATYSVTLSGQEFETGAWKIEDGKVVMDAEDSHTEMEIKDDTLYDPEYDYTLSRNPEDAGQAIEIAPVKAASSAEEFYGDWVCYAVESDGVILGADSLSDDGESMPGITISADKIGFGDSGLLGAIFDLASLSAPSFADGALTAESLLEEVDLDIKAEMLEDGNIKVTLGSEEPMILYYAPAEAE